MKWNLDFEIQNNNSYDSTSIKYCDQKPVRLNTIGLLWILGLEIRFKMWTNLRSSFLRISLFGRIFVKNSCCLKFLTAGIWRWNEFFVWLVVLIEFWVSNHFFERHNFKNSKICIVETSLTFLIKILKFQKENVKNLKSNRTSRALMSCLTWI